MCRLMTVLAILVALTSVFPSRADQESGTAAGNVKIPDPAIRYPQPLAGIDDAKLLPMLEDLPYEYGGMNVARADGRLLHDLIVDNGYRRGLEIGTSNGYSTLWLGLAFRKTGGRVITLEYDARRASEARSNFERAGLADVIDAHSVDAFEEIPKIEGEFDFVFLDAWKPDYVQFWRLLKDRIVPGGAFTAHNVIGHEKYMLEFLAAVRKEPGFETTIYRTSDAGVSISVRRE
jgi:predicted O-methyltransferase YrrM